MGRGEVRRPTVAGSLRQILAVPRRSVNVRGGGDTSPPPLVPLNLTASLRRITAGLRQLLFAFLGAFAGGEGFEEQVLLGAFLLPGGDADQILAFEVPAENFFAQRVLHVLLDRSTQRPGAEVGVRALVDQ